MKQVRFDLTELPFGTLSKFGLTQEMIEDLPMYVLEDICQGKHSPVLPVRVTGENGETFESRTRIAFIRRDDGQADVVFYPVLKSSPLEKYSEAQQKQLLDGKAVIVDVETSDGRHSKAFVQIDPETKQVLSVPTPIIGRNLQVAAEELHLGTAEVNTAGKAGAAISYALGQGAPMIAALWGIFIWKEFKGSSRTVNILLACMFVLFISGLGAIIISGAN